MLSRRAFTLIALHVQRRFVPYLLAAAILVVGIVAGAASVGSVEADTHEEIVEVLAAFFTAALPVETPAVGNVLKEALGGDLLRTGLMMWVLGLTVIGAPLILVMMFFRGYALGFTAGFVISELGWRGTLLAFVSLVPHNLFALTGLLMAAAAGLAFAAGAGRILVGRPGPQTVYAHFASSGGLTLLGGAFLVAGVLAEAYITPVLVHTTMSYLR